MKRFLATVTLLAAVGGTALAAKQSDVLYVGGFEAKGVADAEAQAVESSVCTAATQDRRFVVKCRDTNRAVGDLRTMQAGLGFSEGDNSMDNCGPKGCMDNLAKGVDAKWVLAGSVSKLAEKQFLLTLIVVDPVTNVTLNRTEEKVSGEMSVLVDRVPGAVRRVLTPQQPAKK